MRRAICIILVLTAILLCTACGSRAVDKESDAGTEEASSVYAGFRNTVLYYGSDDGFIVPVMRRIPWEEGIGKAALEYLVNDEDNRLAIAPYGLRALIPEGTGFSLRIGEDGVAKVELNSFPENSASQDIHSAAVAVVNTLTEFEAIDTVSVTVNGVPLGDLTGQSALSEPLSAMALNTFEDAVAVSTEQSYRTTLFFPNVSASLNVPVTSYSPKKPDFFSAVRSLLEGPDNEALIGCFPEGTTVYRAEIDNGEAVIDLSSEYLQVKETEGLMQAGYETLFLTAQCFEPIDSLRLTVNGSAIEDMPLNAPLYANEIN